MSGHVNDVEEGQLSQIHQPLRCSIPFLVKYAFPSPIVGSVYNLSGSVLNNMLPAPHDFLGINPGTYAIGDNSQKLLLPKL